MKKILNKNQEETVKRAIVDALAKRGFHAPIHNFEQVDRKFEFISDNFQTTPVLYKELVIRTFGSSCTEEYGDDGELNKKTFYIDVSIQVMAFDQGQNWIHLFNIKGSFFKERHRCLDLEIK